MRKAIWAVAIGGVVVVTGILLFGFDALTHAAVAAPRLTATASATPIRAYLPAVAAPELPVTTTITGTVVINGGMCCAGGVVGETITLSVQFSATSAMGPVTRMRAGPLSLLSQTPWEDLVPVRNYTTSIHIANWIGWAICAQFRDAQDHVSVPVCDDISVEGMPVSPSPEANTPTPTPTPTSTTDGSQTMTATSTLTPSPTVVVSGT